MVTSPHVHLDKVEKMTNKNSKRNSNSQGTPQQYRPSPNKTPNNKKQKKGSSPQGKRQQPQTPKTPVSAAVAAPTCPSPSRSSPSMYASAKCYQPPTPQSLPKPPTNWVPSDGAAKGSSPFQKLVSQMQAQRERQDDSRDAAAQAEQVNQHLRMLLKVQA